MGCGALCGDGGAQPGSPLNAALNSMRLILPTLGKTSLISTAGTLATFMAAYRNDPKRFHLSTQRHLQKNKVIDGDVLLRWKVVMFAADKDEEKYCNCLNIPEQQKQGSVLVANEPQTMSSTILHHECFSQIDKDLHRTFQLPEGRRKDFEGVLKRIANFFPRVGYTQGMNFIVGFLIIIGYSQDDAFWMFVHTAINRRFLLLGLYEDGFPLNNVFCFVFKNVLRRKNEELYVHLFEELMIDVSMWVFKWFMTCFVYSFPLELGPYALDVIVNLGGLGFVCLAYALTEELGAKLLEKQDMAELSQFLKSLQDVESFNHYVDMEKVLERVYQLQILRSDFEGTENIGGFYSTYFKENCQHFQSHLRKQEPGLPRKPTAEITSTSQILLNKFYQNLTKQKQQFLNINKTATLSLFQLPVESNEKIKGRSNNKSDEIQLIIFSKDDESTSNQWRVNKGSSQLASQGEWRKGKNNYSIQRINQPIQEQESRSALSRLSNQRSSHVSRGSRKSAISKVSKVDSRVNSKVGGSKKTASIGLNHLDELDRLQQDFYEQSKKGVKINNYAQPVNKPIPLRQRASIGGRAESEHAVAVRANGNHRNSIIKQTNNNTFTMAGQNVLNIDNYDAISVSSKNNSKSSKSKKVTIEAKGGRECACKTKTEENRLSNFDKSSDLASSKGQFSDKGSFDNKNMSHTEQAQEYTISMKNVDSHRERVQTHEHILTNSHGPALIGLKESQSGGIGDENRKKQFVEGDSEVQVLPFKKGKRVKEGRVSIL